MAGKTNTDIIRELEKSVAMLVERIDHVRNDIRRMDDTQTRMSDQANRFETRLTVLEKEMDGIKMALKEGVSRRWTLIVALLAALFGGVVSQLLGGFLRMYLDNQ